MRKPDFCIFENKDADQLCGYRTADQRLCFLYIDSTIPLFPKSQISRLWPFSVAVQFDLSVGPGQKPRRQVFSRCGSFYNCRCGKCVGDPRAKCSWNSNTTTCVPLDDSSDIFIQQVRFNNAHIFSELLLCVV